MEPFSNHDRIEEYLKGELSSSEKTAFEKELLSNKVLQTEVHKTQLLHALLAEKRLLDLKGFAKESYEADQSKSTWRNYTLGLLLIATAGGTAWLISSPSNTDTPSAKTQHSKIQDSAPNKVQMPTESKQTLPAQPKAALQKPASSIPEPTKPQEAPLYNKEPQTIENKHLNTEHKNENLKIEPTKTPLNTEPCKHIVLHADIQTYPTCLYQEKGTVSLSNMGGGTAPYSFVVKNQEGEVLMPTQLPEGSYTVDLQDGQHCHTLYHHVEVKTKMCAQNYAFNPYTGEVWEVPSYKHSGKLSVVDKAGNIYLSKEIPANSQETWDGSSPLGELKIGYYLYSISYTDGTELRGAVTLLK